MKAIQFLPTHSVKWRDGDVLANHAVLLGFTENEGQIVVELEDDDPVVAVDMTPLYLGENRVLIREDGEWVGRDIEVLPLSLLDIDWEVGHGLAG